MSRVYKVSIEVAPYLEIEAELSVAPAEPEVGIMSPQVEDVDIYFRPRDKTDAKMVAEFADIKPMNPLTDRQLELLVHPLFMFQEWDYRGQFNGSEYRKWLDEYAVNEWESGKAWSDWDE